MEHIGTNGSLLSRRRVSNIDAPLSTRMQARLERAAAQAIRQPSRALPTLRRAIVSATTELRALGYNDERIRTIFSQLIEDVARARSLDATSIISGHPRWVDLTVRVLSWTEIAGEGEQPNA
jgi:hypothetical protein